MNPLNDDCQPKFIDPEAASPQEEDTLLKAYAQECPNILQYAAPRSHSFILEDRTEVCDPEQAEKVHPRDPDVGTSTNQRCTAAFLIERSDFMMAILNQFRVLYVRPDLSVAEQILVYQVYVTATRHLSPDATAYIAPIGIISTGY
jgi:hypothetical protein